MTQHLLLSSQFRDRTLYPNPFNFSVSTNKTPYSKDKTTLMKQAKNPISSELPRYHFSFYYTDAMFSCSIISMEGNSIFLSETIDELLYSNNNYSIPLKHKSVDSLYDALRGFYIHIKIVNSQFTRKIINFDPISRIATIESPFPLVISSNTYIPSFITSKLEMNRQNELTCNGTFLQKSNFIFNNPNGKVLIYKLTTNEFSRVTEIEEEKLVLETPFLSSSEKDQYMLFFTNTTPIVGKIIPQINQEYISYQPAKVSWTLSSSQYINNDVVILKTMEEDSYSKKSTYFHEYKMIKLNSNTLTLNNLELTKLGTQKFEKNIKYSLVVTSRVENTPPAILMMNQLHALFCLEMKNPLQNINILEDKFFLPNVMTNLFYVDSNELYVQPNNSLNVDSLSESMNTLSDHFNSTGVSPIVKVNQLSDSTLAIQTYALLDYSKMTLIPKYIQDNPSLANCIISRFSYDSSIGIDHLLLGGTKEKKIKLKNIIVPNMKLKNNPIRLSDLPYIYMNLNTLKIDQIYTNNPNIKKNMKVYIPLGDVLRKKDSPFLHIDCATILQEEIEFMSKDTFEVKFYLPNGDLLEVTEQDTVLPYQSRTDLEITLLLEVQDK